MSDDEDDSSFSAILEAIDQSKLTTIASVALCRVNPRFSPGSKPPSTPIVDKPIFGSYHVLFPLTFVGLDVKWLVKVPKNGTHGRWDELCASALASEAQTMRLLRRTTSIPLPEVIDFSSSLENPLRSPYMIVSFITGIPLYDVWFGHRLNPGVVNPEKAYTRRTRALEGVAAAMTQLGHFTFPKSGAILFGSNGMPSGVGPMRRLDHQASLDASNSDDVYVSCPPLENPKDYFTFMLDLHPTDHPFSKWVVALLRHFIGWIPDPSSPGDCFVLAHPDFDIQNIIVSEEGELRGIIDWDGVAAVPRSIGNERYPSWLTRDWDPLMYGYEESMDLDNAEPAGLWEDSPASLAQYRGVYAELMVQHRRNAVYAPAGAPFDDICRLSLLAENLAIAAEDPRCRGEIMYKMIREMWAAAAAAPSNAAGIAAGGIGDAPDLIDLVEMLAEGKTDTPAMQTLKAGFDVLLSKTDL